MSGTQAPQRAQLRVAGMLIQQYVSLTVERDLQNISGTMHAEIFDQARIAGAQSLPGAVELYSADAGTTTPIVAGMPFTVTIDGTLLMSGWIDAPETEWDGGKLSTHITGRDKTGDLADCAAVPNGPAEFKNVDLLHVAQVLCAPFGITPIADVDVGDPFVRLAIGPHETVLAALEKASRQRAVLLLSDGIGHLMLTRGGNTRAPAPLQLGGNVFASKGKRSWEKRFSDYFVKGQTERCLGARKGKLAHLDSTVVPFTADGGAGNPAPAANVAPEASAILMTGHAIDPEITRWRPTVRMTRSQSGMSTTQQQAEWALRVARGEGDHLTYTVLDWRAPKGQVGTLWRPNQVSAVFDPVALVDQDMLIAGCSYQAGAEGLKTVLRVVGVTAYDRIDEAAKHRTPTGRKAKGNGPQDSTLAPFSAP